MSEFTRALVVVGDATGNLRPDYCFEGRFKYHLDDHWSLLISPDSARRVRLDVCLRSSRVSSMWSRVDDHDRLAALVISAQSEIAALA